MHSGELGSWHRTPHVSGPGRYSERKISSVLLLSVFLAQADSLKVSIKALDALKLRAEALHERVGNSENEEIHHGPITSESKANSYQIESFDFLEDLVTPVDEPELDTTITHVLAHSAQKATLIDLAYQSSALTSSIFAQLLTLRSDVEETSSKEKDFKAKKSTFQSLLVAFKTMLLSYTSEECNYKFLLKKQIRKEYLSLRPDASEAEVYKAVEDRTDWGMGLVRRDPVASFVERLGLGDSGSTAGDNEFYSANGGWEDTTPEVKDVLDRVAGLRGEVKRVEGIIKELRGLYRELEGLGTITKRYRLTSQGSSPALSVGNSGLHGGGRLETRNAEVLCCGLPGVGTFRGWAAGILTALSRTGIGALALFDGFMMGVRREGVRGVFCNLGA